MSSIIVLDSSDEDETPPKKFRKLISSPLAVKINSSTGSSIITATTRTRYEQSPCKGVLAKQPSQPSNTFATSSARRSPNTGQPKRLSTCDLSSQLAANSNNTSRNTVINLEQQRATNSPKNVGQQQQHQQQCRTRSTPTPPQSRSNSLKSPFSLSPFSSTCPSPSPLTVTTSTPLPTLMPAISSIHMLTAAGAAPPLQLLASTSPPLGLDIPSSGHNTSPIDIIKTNATAGTTNKTSAIAEEVRKSSISSTTANQLPSPQTNMNINFKIHLPRKSVSTPPIVSPPPASFGTCQTTSPQSQLQPSLSSIIQTSTGRLDKLLKRVKPITLIKPTDEVWLRKKESQRQQNATKRKSSSSVITLNEDISLEMVSPSTIESPKSSRTSPSSSSAESVTKSRKSSTDVIVLSPTRRKSTIQPTILDLTCSPDKRNDTITTATVATTTTATTTSATTIIDLVRASPTKDKLAQLNGDIVTSKLKLKPATNEPVTMNDEAVKIKDVKESSRKPPLEPEYEELIKVCRQAEPSDDMEKLIRSKLVKYYYEVHPDFVRSKSFRKSIKRCIDIIRSEPDLVYYNLKTIVDELKVRRKSHPIIVEEEDQNQQEEYHDDDVTEISNNFIEKQAIDDDDSDGKKSIKGEERPPTGELIKTGNKKTDEQIRKLNKALYILTKRIEALEQTEVDWDDEDSIYLQTERFKKRACQIYEKICDLTGESKNAYRMVKKPIKFNGTRIPYFNKTLQAFINRTKEFPDYYDVLRMLEYCNRTYDLGLVNFEIKNIAEDAFIKVGKLLQSRRKTELYEALNYFTENNKDPANNDTLLAAKLHENQQKHKKINDVLDKYVRRQEMPDAPDEEAKENVDGEDLPTCSQNASAVIKQRQEQKQHHQQQQSNQQQTQLLDGNSIQSNDHGNAEVNTSKMRIIKNLPNCHNAIEDVDETVIRDAYEEEYNDDDDDEYDEEEDDDDDDDEVNLEEHVETLANGDITDNETDTDIILNDSSNETGGNVIKLDDKHQNSATMIGKNPNKTTTTTSKIISNNNNNNNNNNTDATQQQQIVIKTSDKIFMNNNNNSNNNNHVKKSIKTLNVYDEQCPIKILSNSPRTTTTATTTANGKIKLNNADAKSAVRGVVIGVGGRRGDVTNDDNDNIITITDAITCNSINYNKITATNTTTNITATNTTTTPISAASFKIVAVSSLNQQHQYQQQINDVEFLATSKATLSSAHKTNKSLEEIIISDEES